MSKDIFFTKQVNKYQGKYVAVAKDKVLASGKDATEAWRLAKKIQGRKKIDGVYYIPGKQDVLTALCVFPTKSSTKITTCRSLR